MIRLFNIKSPRLEAFLLFVAAIKVCGSSIILRATTDTLSPTEAHNLGIPEPLMLWPLLRCIVAAPFLAGMMIVDRLLTVRTGFAAPAWALVGAGLFNEVALLLAVPLATVSAATVALFAASAAISLHGRSLWIGLSDQGFVGLRHATRSATGHRPARNPAEDDQAAWSVPNPHSRKYPAPVQRRAARLPWVVIFTTVVASYIVNHRAQAAGPQPQDGPAPLPNIVTPAGRPNDPLRAGSPTTLPNIIAPEAGASAARRNNGHFYFDTLVNGRPASMVLDTGATVVTIRAEEAARLGLPVEKLKYSITTATANGAGAAAPVTIDTLTVGTITLHDVPAWVLRPGALNENLLGQSFLRNLRQVNVENDRVTLKGK